MKRHTWIISRQQGRLRRKRQWNHLIAKLPTTQVNLKVTSFLPLQKLKGTQPTRTPAVWVTNLEEEGTNKEGGAESEDPDGIKGVTEEFIVSLARALKDVQQEKHCYHCSSPEHFIHKCPLVNTSRTATHLN